MRTLVRACLPFVLLAACEPRVEEPLPPPKATTPLATASERAAEAPASSAGGDGRCIKRTPDKPARTVTGPVPDPNCPEDDTAKPAPLRTAKVTFPDAKNESVTVEVTEKDRDRQRGLMFRKSMPENHGMIFAFENRENHNFWMHNTCIPLDMLFIDHDGTIVGIEENVPTMDDSTFQVGCPSSYVLELNAGWTRKHGVKAGQSVKLDGI